MSLRDHRDDPAGDPNLFCYGCAHSAASADFPGVPSGERPCGFCIRNPEWEKFAEGTGYKREWYDRSPPVSVPMDCYHSVDMLRQIRAWATDDVKP